MGNLLCTCLEEEDEELNEVEEHSPGVETKERSVHSHDPSAVLIKYVYNLKHACNWSKLNTCYAQCVTLNEESKDYQMVKRKFENTSRNQNFVLQKIERIENPFLYGQYLLKEEELLSRYGYVENDLLFHGTRSFKTSNILQNNFDWRLHGTSKGERFGKGACFTPIAAYAGHYCDENNPKVMFLCNVLIAKECLGREELIVPNVYNSHMEVACDTAVNDKRTVFVKFSDHEFYPTYKITFCVDK